MQGRKHPNNGTPPGTAVDELIHRVLTSSALSITRMLPSISKHMYDVNVGPEARI
jgi:hypothetical protein